MSMPERSEFSPMIVAFCCDHSAYPAADQAGRSRMTYPSEISLIRVPCSGKVDVLHILRAFEKGADGVMVLGCPEGSCHDLSGNVRVRKRVAHANDLLVEIGMGGERARMFTLAPNMTSDFVRIANEMTEEIRTLGPSPLKE